MKKYIAVLLSVVIAFSMAGCANMSKRDAGMVAGGVLGGVAGHELTGGSAVGTVGGAVGGAYLGTKIAE